MLLIRTSSHMWGRWYLPMFLFRDGLLTLMNIDYLINLERFCSSLPTMLKLSSVVVWPVVLLWSWIGEGSFRCSLNLSKCSSSLSCVLLITFQPVTFESIYFATLFCYVVFIFWCHPFIFYGFSTLEVYLDAISFANVLEALTKSFIVRYSYVTFADGFAVFFYYFWLFLEYLSSVLSCWWPMQDICRWQRTNTYTEGSVNLQISYMGHQQDETEEDKLRANFKNR